MKTMKILSILAIIFGFSQCGSVKFDENPPFKVQKSTYTNWSGGQPGVRGIKVEITISDDDETTFDTLFFRNMKTKLEKVDVNGKTVLIGHFNTSTIKRDIVLDVDATKELNNEVPKVEKLPFELKKDEAVITYQLKDKLHYYKLKPLQEKKQEGQRFN
ncbi:MAG: hypothetical protein AB8B78_07490 [Polaribacter sp.]